MIPELENRLIEFRNQVRGLPAGRRDRPQEDLAPRRPPFLGARLLAASTRALFAEVLLACALTRRNELGWFVPVDVRGPSRAITGREYEDAGYSQHLHLLAAGRGRVLERSGTARRYSV